MRCKSPPAVMMMMMLLPILAVAGSLVVNDGVVGRLLFSRTSEAGLKHFQSLAYNQNWSRYISEDTNAFLRHLQSVEPLVEDLSSIHQFKHAAADINAGITLYSRNGTKLQTNTNQPLSPIFIQSLLDSGHSMVVKKEKFNTTLSPLQKLLQTTFATDVTVHGYVTPRNAQALKPHTDPYDVFVLQLFGAKTWTLCTPRLANATGMNPAEKAQMQELARNNLRGCTSYTKQNLRSMDCQTLTMHSGDVLYMPKGIIHYAETRQEASIHLTIGLLRQGHTWKDLMYRYCRLSISDNVCKQLNALVMKFSETRTGLAWNDLAAAPFAKDPFRGICKRITKMLASTQLRTFLSKTSQSYDTQRLLSSLDSFAECKHVDVKALLHDPAAHAQIVRTRRQEYWHPPCRDGKEACRPPLGCDCDEDCDDCDFLGFDCDQSCDGSCACDESVVCNPGYIQRGQWFQAICDSCPPGKYKGWAGSSGCRDCPVGKHASRHGSRVCEACAVGKYQPQTGQAHCLDAGVGHFVPLRGASYRRRCKAGRYAAGNRSESCIPCTALPWPGTYQPSDVQGNCIACPEGKYARGDKATSCTTVPKLSVNPQYNAKSIDFTIDDSELEWIQFRITLGLWRQHEFFWDVAASFPRVVEASRSASGALLPATTISLNRLIPGQYYHIQIEARSKNAPEGDFSGSNFTVNLASTTCGCRPQESTGTPTSLEIYQYLGKIYFKWQDQSFCEDGFSFQRDGVAFTGSYDITSSAACGRLHEPETVYDDIVSSRELTVGSSYSYCIFAYSHSVINWAEDESVSASYESNPRCHPFVVEWEASVVGSVRLSELAGSMPVKDTVVEWSIAGGAVNGSTVTDEDGRFEIYVLSSALHEEFETMIISVSKRSASVEHQYECDGQPCTQRSIRVKAFTFDRVVEFTDTSAVAFEGRILIDGTQHSEHPNGCPLSGVSVCLHDHIHHQSIGCALSDASGHYEIPAAIGLGVYPVIQYDNHTFERLTGSGLRPATASVETVDATTGLPLKYDWFLIEEDALAQQETVFIDTTYSTVSVTMAGGKCKHPLGNTTVSFSYADCPTWSKTASFTRLQTAIKMPAQLYQVELVGVSSSDVNLGSTVRDYFAAKNSVVQQADLTAEPVELEWEYHPEPTIELSIPQATFGTCEVNVIHRDVVADIVISVSEHFWSDVPSCTWIEGNVTVTNGLGESTEDTDALLKENAITKDQAELLKKCADGCVLPLGLQQDGQIFSDASVTVQVLTGEPELVATIGGIKHAKPIRVDMTVDHYTISKLFPIIVTGQKVISDKFTMDLPQYMPLLIIYDPPGGQSYATYEAVESSFTLKHEEYAHYEGWYIKGSAALALENDVNACVGFGVELCAKVSKHEGEAGVEHDSSWHNAKIRADRNHDDSTTFTSTFTISTSNDLGLPSGHLIITPSLTVKFAETRVLSYNFTTCAVNDETVITWTLDGATASFTLKAYSDIVGSEIPTLQNNLKAAQRDLAELLAGDNPDSDQVQEAQTNIAKVEEAIQAWNHTVGYIDSTLEMAEQDELPPATDLMPSQLTQLARTLDNISDPSAKEVMRDYNTISFTGGGHAYEYLQSTTSGQDRTSGKKQQDDFQTGGYADYKFIKAVLGFHGTFGAGDSDSKEGESLTTTGSETESSRGFVLQDDDGGDKFVVKVFRDPIYDTFVFVTVAGSSKCPHEHNTYAREQPRIQLVHEPVGAVLPHEAAIFKINLINEANEANQYELYVRDVEGAAVEVNGDTLAQAQFYEQMPPYSQYAETVMVRRASSSYKYEFTLGFRSRCERELFLVLGNWPASDFQHQEVTITAEFLEPCSIVQWSGALAETSTFTINFNGPAALEVQVANPESPDRFWEDNSRLQSIRLEYKPAMRTTWLPAKLDNGSIVDFKDLESPYGYASQAWHVSTLPDGVYDIRLVSRCAAAGMNMPEGVNDAHSTVIRGKIDRTPPKQFDAVPEPSDGIYGPGDHIGVALTEDVDCARPFQFDVTVSVGDRMTLRKSSLDIVCEGRYIEVSLANRLSNSALAGNRITVVVSGVRDLAGNTLTNPITWSFVAMSESTSPSSIVLEDVKFAMAYQAEWDDDASQEHAEIAFRLGSDLAQVLDVSLNRVEVTKLSRAADNTTLATVTLKPPQSQRRRASNDQLSADELSIIFFALYENISSAPSVSNTSLIALLDLSNAPSPRVEQSRSSNSDAAVTPQSGLAQSHDSADTSWMIVIVVMLALLMLQGSVMLYMMIMARVNIKSVLQMDTPAQTASEKQKRLSSNAVVPVNLDSV